MLWLLFFFIFHLEQEGRDGSFSSITWWGSIFETCCLNRWEFLMMKANFLCVEIDSFIDARYLRGFGFFFWALVLDPPLSNSCRTNLFIYCSFGVSLQMGRAYASLTVKVTGHSFTMNAPPLFLPLLHLLRDGSCINARLPWTDEISLVCVTSCLISCHTRRGGFYHSACVFQNVSDVQ